MKPSAASFIDSHVHLDIVFANHPGRIGWYMEHGCIPVSWAYFKRVASTIDLTRRLSVLRDTLRTIRKSGLSCFFLVGVHPRNIPMDLDPARIPEMLAPYLEDPHCLGIGEIGLETGDSLEKEVFAAHLSMAESAVQAGKVIGVHTPRSDKARMTGEVLSMLEGLKGFGDSVVVDHTTPVTAGDVLAAGFTAGVTLSREKCSADDLVRILEAHPDRKDRILLNTDSGESFHEDLPAIRNSGLFSEDDRDALFRDNAARFYGI